MTRGYYLKDAWRRKHDLKCRNKEEKYVSASESHWITSSTVWMDDKVHVYGEIIILSLETEFLDPKKIVLRN